LLHPIAKLYGWMSQQLRLEVAARGWSWRGT